MTISPALSLDLPGPCFCKYDRWNRKMYVPGTVNDIGLSECASFKAWLAFKQAQHECGFRWNRVKQDVLEFLKAAKSLNEAIKLWPDLQRYCPDEVIKKMNTKTERTKSESSAADVLAKIDVDAVNMSTVLARMAGAKV